MNEWISVIDELPPINTPIDVVFSEAHGTGKEWFVDEAGAGWSDKVLWRRLLENEIVRYGDSWFLKKDVQSERAR